MSVNKLSKHTSRLAAVQVMYQLDMTEGDLEKVISDFLIHYVNKEEEYHDINLSFFKKLTNHFVGREELNELINKNLQASKVLNLPSSITRSILKVAIIEMLHENTDIPIIINEFVNISKYFVDNKNVKFINAILDAISKQVERQCKVKA